MTEPKETGGARAGLQDWLTDTAYGLGWKLVCRMPEAWARWQERHITFEDTPGPADGVPELRATAFSRE